MGSSPTVGTVFISVFFKKVPMCSKFFFFLLCLSGSVFGQTLKWSLDLPPIPGPYSISLIYDMQPIQGGGAAVLMQYHTPDNGSGYTFETVLLWISDRGKILGTYNLGAGVGGTIFRAALPAVLVVVDNSILRFTIRKGKLVLTTSTADGDLYPSNGPVFFSDPGGFLSVVSSAGVVSKINRYRN